MKLNDNAYDTPIYLVETFAEYFSSVYKTSSPVGLDTLINNNIFFDTVAVSHISEEEISQVLTKFKNSFTMGYDLIPSFILKDCLGVFVKPLYRIFNLILLNLEFPSFWKKAIVCPIFKKGDTARVDTYRPISLLCNFAKVLMCFAQYTSEALDSQSQVDTVDCT